MTFAENDDDYVMGYINALLDTQSSLDDLAMCRQEGQWFKMYEMARNNEGDFADFLGIDKMGDELRFELEAVMLRYFMSMMIVKELTVSEFADIVHSVENLELCESQCEKRGMIGRSWWKRLGYNSPCSCAYMGDMLRYKSREIK
tara:strand:- start:208 stop:642 length:435 start_codon:yes stop_codon:yes gene_type:complete